MHILAIDPGPKQSAYIIWNTSDEKPVAFNILDNEQILILVKTNISDAFVIEMMQGFGMPVGQEVFNTCVWIGRFLESHMIKKLGPGTCAFIYRKDIKLYFCGSVRAKDANIRQALIDRFGRQGTKKNPGTLYGIKRDVWSALALAVYYQDMQKRKI